MTIQFLKYIAAVAEHGSITEASRQMHISQPSLSAAIKEAENEIGFAIFHRSRSGIALTMRIGYVLCKGQDLSELASIYIEALQKFDPGIA